MRIFFLLIFYFSLGSFYAQNITIITYNVQTNEPLMSSAEKAENPSIVDIFQGVETALNTLEFKLQVKNNKSKFTLQDIMQIDERSSKIAKGLVDDSQYFRDGQKSIVKRFAYEKSYLVKYNLIKKWDISNDTKTINSNLCYKATTTKFVESKDKIREIPVLAWFCPKIPLPFGPKQYGDLPGLILELSEGRITFLATKIELNQKDENDFFPNFGKDKIYSEEEFTLIARENTRKIQGNRGF